MKYDFTSLMNRSGHDAIAVDRIPIPGAEVKEGFSRIPMWVADMNFPSLPTIQEAMHARVNEPHFGYFDLPDAYFAISSAGRKSATVWKICRVRRSAMRTACSAVLLRLLPLLHPRANPFFCIPRHTSVLPVFLRTADAISFSPILFRMRTAYGVWTTPIWTAS